MRLAADAAHVRANDIRRSEDHLKPVRNRSSRREPGRRAVHGGYTIPTSTAEDDEECQDILSLLCRSGYREDFRNLLPWAVDSAGSDNAYDGRSVTLILFWGASADETCSLVLTGRQIVVSRPHHDGFLIYHPLDTALLDQLTEYLMTHGEKG